MSPTVADKTTKSRSSAKTKLRFRPLGDRIVVKRAEAEAQTDSGIYLPESAKDKPKHGTVIAVGNGRLNHETGEYTPFTVEVGQSVLFTSYAGTEVKIDGEELLIMTEDDVLAIVD